MAGGRQTYFRLQNWRNSTVAGNLNFCHLTIRPPRHPTQQQKTAQVGYFLSWNKQKSYPQHQVSPAPPARRLHQGTLLTWSGKLFSLPAGHVTTLPLRDTHRGSREDTSSSLALEVALSLQARDFPPTEILVQISTINPGSGSLFDSVELIIPFPSPPPRDTVGGGCSTGQKSIVAPPTEYMTLTSTWPGKLPAHRLRPFSASGPAWTHPFYPSGSTSRDQWQFQQLQMNSAHSNNRKCPEI